MQHYKNDDGCESYRGKHNGLELDRRAAERSDPVLTFVLALALRFRIDGCSFRDFIKEAERDGLGASFAKAYREGKTIPDHFRDMESLLKCARSIHPRESLLEDVESLWRDYKRWRMDMIHAIAHNEIDGDEGI